jgi:hypothetical protein
MGWTQPGCQNSFPVVGQNLYSSHMYRPIQTKFGIELQNTRGVGGGGYFGQYFDQTLEANPRGYIVLIRRLSLTTGIELSKYKITVNNQVGFPIYQGCR